MLPYLALVATLVLSTTPIHANTQSQQLLDTPMKKEKEGTDGSGNEEDKDKNNDKGPVDIRAHTKYFLFQDVLTGITHIST